MHPPTAAQGAVDRSFPKTTVVRTTTVNYLSYCLQRGDAIAGVIAIKGWQQVQQAPHSVSPHVTPCHLRVTPCRPRVLRVTPCRPRVTPCHLRVTPCRPRVTCVSPCVAPVSPACHPVSPRVACVLPRVALLRCRGQSGNQLVPPPPWNPEKKGTPTRKGNSKQQPQHRNTKFHEGQPGQRLDPRRQVLLTCNDNSR